MTTSATYSKHIREALRERKSDGMRKCDLRRRLGCETRAEQNAFRDAFRQLLDSGVIVKKHRARYVLAESAQLVPGTLWVHPHGFGFVRPEGGEDRPDVFVPAKGLLTALSGDRVLVAITEPDNERGPAGRIHRVLERKHTEISGCLEQRHGQFCIRPLRAQLPESIPIRQRKAHVELSGASPGDWVVAHLCSRDDLATPLEADIVTRLGAGDNMSVELDAVVREFALMPPYSADEQRAAAKLEPEIVPREDLRGLATITIDPEDAKDFDDALSVQPGENAGTITVGVHIADVAAFVRPDGELDNAARERAFTAYLPGRTLPMLPETLAGDRCSLLVGEDRPAHSVLFELDAETGRILRTRRSHTMIRVTCRLSFQDALDLLHGKNMPAEVEPAREPLRTLDMLGRKLREHRAAEEQFLDIALPEVRVLCAENPPRVLGLSRVAPNAAHALVEEFMLAANVAVAEEMTERKIPGLFRVHAAPRPADIEGFREWVGMVTGRTPGRLDARAALNRFLIRMADSPLRDLLLTNLLSAMQRAGYSAANEAHFGLGKACYCHFTSPIRRYPDLLVHQQLMAREQGVAERSTEACAEIGAHCSLCERRIDEAYYAATDRLKLRYLRQQVETGDRGLYEGVVAQVNREGLRMYLPELGLFGQLPRHRLELGLGSGKRHAFEQNTGRSNGKIARIGDVIYVQVQRTDVVRGGLSLDAVRPQVTF